MDFKNLSEADAMRAASEDLGLPPEFFDRMWATESGRGKSMRSAAGARGHFQIMPATQAAWEKRMGRPLDPDNFQDSLIMAHATMKENLARFKDPVKATAAYNGGWKEENWSNPETAAYVPKVLGKALDGTPVQVSPEDIAPAKPVSLYSGTAAASAMLAAEGSAALEDQLTPAFAEDQKAEQLRRETGVLDVAAAAITDPRVMGTWAILDRINKAPDDPNFDYAANIDKIEGVDWSDEERAWARENVRSLEQAREYKNRVAYQRQLDTTVYSRASTGENLLGQFAAGMADPAGWVAGLTTAKAFQLAKISSGALAAAGRGKAAVGAAMLEAGLGEVAYEGALAMAGEQKTGEDYLMALGLGVAMQAPFSGGVYRQAVDAQLVQTANNLTNTAAQAQANAWAQGLTPPQQAQTQVAEIDALVQSANVPQAAASVADGVVIPTDLQQAMIQEDTGGPPELVPAAQERPVQAQEGAQAPTEAPPATQVLVTQENLPELHQRAEQATLVAIEPGPDVAALDAVLTPELREPVQEPVSAETPTPEQEAKLVAEQQKTAAIDKAWTAIADALVNHENPQVAWDTWAMARDPMFEPGYAVLDEMGFSKAALWDANSPATSEMLDKLSETLHKKAKEATAAGVGTIQKEVPGVVDGAGPVARATAQTSPSLDAVVEPEAVSPSSERAQAALAEGATEKTAQVIDALETGSMVETVVRKTETEELRVGWAFDHAKAAKQKANKNNLYTTNIGKLLAKVKKSWLVSNMHVTQFSDVASYLLDRMDKVALEAPVYIRRLQKRGYMEPDTGAVVLPDQPTAKLPNVTESDILQGMDQHSAETLIHEIIHAATAVSLEAVETAVKAGKKVSPKAKASYETLVAIRKQLKASQDAKEFPEVAYAAKNVHELVAQAVSDKATMRALVALPGKGVESDSALDDFVSAVTSLIGMPRAAATGTALEDTLASIHTLIKFHGTVKDVNGLPIMGAWANKGGKSPSATSQAILRSLLLKSGQKSMTTRTMLDHGLKFPKSWETKIAKLSEGSEWEGMDPLDVPVFFHGASADFVTTQGGVIPGKNYGNTIFLATGTNTSKSFAGIAYGAPGYVWPMLFAPRKGTLADWRNPEHIAKIKEAINTKVAPEKRENLLSSLNEWAKEGYWVYADVLRKGVLEPHTDFVAHYETESTHSGGDIPKENNKAGYSLPDSLGGEKLPNQGNDFLNIALWDQTYLKLIVENDGTFDVGGAPNILSGPPNPIQQSATQVKFAARMYEHAREWVRKNPIDRKRLDVLTKKWGYVLSDGLKLASSNNPILNMVAGLITETTTGAAGRRNTAAIRKELIHKKLMGNALINVEGLYTVWRDKNGGSVIQDFKNGDHRRRFESLVHDELLARRYGTAQTIDPSIRKAADEWEAMFQRALDQQKASGVLGSAYLPETSKGYVPQSLDGGKLAVATKQELDALADHLAEHFAQLYDWSADFAKQFAPFYINRARRRAMGEKGVDSATMGGNATEAVKDALEEMKLEPSVMTKALASTDRVGGQSQTKKRLDVDLLGTLPNGKRVKDYYVTDVSLLARNYANRTAGTAALTEFGILGWRGVRNLLDSVRTASDKPGELATSEEIEAAERVLAEMLGTPWVGETRSALASGARLTVGLQRLGGLVFTQAAEVWNMTHQLGLSATLKGIASLPRMLGDVRTRKNGGAYKGLLESLETWGGEIGMETYKLQARLDAPDEYLRDYGKSNSLALRLLNAGGQLQAKISFFQGLMAAQHRMVAEQITRKVLRYAKEGKANDTYLKDMGFDAETIQAIRLGLSASTKFDSRGRVISFDVSKLGSAKLAETFVQSVHRGTAQIIQGTFIGERAAWAHNDWAKLLLQLRTFGLTSVEKQWGRTRMNSGYAAAAGMLLGQMALALPVYLARVSIASAGREDQEEFLERNTNPAAVTRALLNYSSLSGLSGDVLDLMTGIAGGWGGQDAAEAIGARQQATSVGGLIPVAGSIDSASRVLSGKTDVHTAIKQLPLSNLWYIAPIINLTKQD